MCIIFIFSCLNCSPLAAIKIGYFLILSLITHLRKNSIKQYYKIDNYDEIAYNVLLTIYKRSWKNVLVINFIELNAFTRCTPICIVSYI